ncbi:MAG: GntR family transcriptional regulator, partial [Lachnospiraceae bacterium]|nr:GntR family transcriptional regulator [Lachnospiraceae bacterium]
MKDMLQENMDEYLPLWDVVFKTLRQAILTGELEPGERLMEIHLAKRLGVSRTPIREAIHKLELEGLVTMVPRKGARVAQITQKNLKDVLEV